jgi:hypothetical protein
MCSHHRPTRDDQQFLKGLKIARWSMCALCARLAAKLRTEESENREGEDGA